MAGFADLAGRQPALLSVARSGYEGKTWRYSFFVYDDANALVNLSGTTGTCRIETEVNGALVVAPVYSVLSTGLFKVEVSAANSANLANGSKVRQCVWSLSVTNGTDTVQFWGPYDSNFYVLAD